MMLNDVKDHERILFAKNEMAFGISYTLYKVKYTYNIKYANELTKDVDVCISIRRRVYVFVSECRENEKFRTI